MILLPCKEHHIKTLAANLRREDHDELHAAYGQNIDIPSLLLQGWKEATRCEVILTDSGVVAGVWGTFPFQDQGCMWMLATPALHKIELAFLRETRAAIGRAHTEFEVLYATPWVGNGKHIHWLKWAGFELARSDLNFPTFKHVRTSSDPHRNGSSGGSGVGNAVFAAEQGDHCASLCC